MSIDKAFRKLGDSLIVLLKLQVNAEDNGEPDNIDLPFYRKIVKPYLTLSPGCMDLHQTLEHVLTPPFKVKTTEHSKIFVTNPKYTRHPNKAIRNLIVFIAFCACVFSSARTVWLQQTWDRKHDMAQLFLYMVISCISLVGLSAISTLHCQRKIYLFLVVQRFEMTNRLKEKVEMVKTVYNISVGDILAYGFGITFASFPLFVLFAPLTLDFCPLGILFRYIFGSTVMALDIELWYKYGIILMFGCIYAVIVCYGAGIMLCLMIVLIVYVEGIQKVTGSLYKRNTLKGKNCKLQFYRVFKSFRQVQILVDQMNFVLSRFTLIMTVVGILLAGWSAYATLMMRHELPLITYLSCIIIVALCLIIDFVLIGFASIPNRDGEIFKQYWKSVLKLRVEKRQLLSCPSIGYNIGPLINVKMSMALSIACAMADCTANIVLLNVAAKMKQI